MRLQDRTIVVTGAASGLGAAMSRAFVAEGARLIASDVNEDRLADLEAEVSGPGEVVSVIADVRDPDDVDHLIERAGALDVLVNNAALRQFTVTGEDPRPVEEIDPEVWDAVIETNIRGPYLCTRAALPVLRETGGRLIFLSSGMAYRADPRRSPYAASKFGLRGFCGSLIAELDGSDVDAVLFRPPGAVYTDNFRAHNVDPGRFDYEPSVVEGAAVRLAAGEGEHGGHYVATEDGEGFEPETLG